MPFPVNIPTAAAQAPGLTKAPSTPLAQTMAPVDLTPLPPPASLSTSVPSLPAQRTPVLERRIARFEALQQQLLGKLAVLRTPQTDGQASRAIAADARAACLTALAVLTESRQAERDA
jgi:hypothetical protein